MELSPEERKRIYEEEKARIEAEAGQSDEGESSLKLEPGVAALLCYLGLWVTGIIFVVLETKNRYVRFHAVQSIIVFGVLAVAGGLLQQLTYAGWFFGIVFGIITLVLWIVLMVKAYHGELYRVPLAGDLAVRISGVSVEETEVAAAAAPAQAEQPAAAVEPPKAVESPKAVSPNNAHRKARAGRMTASGLSIAWSIIWLVVLNYFSQYIAFYQLETTGGVNSWVGYPLLTGEFALWLPFINTVLILSIIGHIIAMVFDKYVLREIILIILNVFSIVAVARLLSLFPFDFSQTPNSVVDTVGPILATIVLLGIIIGMGIATLVGFIKLIVNVVSRNNSY